MVRRTIRNENTLNYIYKFLHKFDVDINILNDEDCVIYLGYLEKIAIEYNKLEEDLDKRRYNLDNCLREERLRNKLFEVMDQNKILIEQNRKLSKSLEDRYSFTNSLKNEVDECFECVWMELMKYYKKVVK